MKTKQVTPDVQDFTIEEISITGLTLKVYVVKQQALLIEVVEQDDELIERGEYRFKASNGIWVSSTVCPSLSLSITGHVFIRGIDRNKDSNIMHFRATSVHGTENFLHNLKIALEEMEKDIVKKQNKVVPSYDFLMGKIIDFMKWKRDRILKYQIENDLEPIVYFTEKDEKSLRGLLHDISDLIYVYNKLENNVIKGAKSGLNGATCPYCMLLAKTESYCKECLWGEEHGKCNDATYDFWKIRRQIETHELFKSKDYKTWWENYDNIFRQRIKISKRCGGC